jgi:CIC family chloride channel protein
MANFVLSHLRDAQTASGRFLRNRQFVLFVLAVALGAVAGGGAIGFRELIALVQTGALGFGSERVFTLAAGLPWWQVLLVPAVGGLLVGLFIRYAMPNGRPEGVANVMEAAALRGGRMGLRAGFGAALASAASIGVGASVGREGPVVHLGATLSAWAARRLGLSRGLIVTLLGCGVASAIAASFNAPIAGVFFALEVVVGHYALSSFAPIVIAAVTGTVITRLYYGDFPAFIILDHNIVSFLEFPAFALLGIVSAGVAVFFIKGTHWSEDQFGKLPVPGWVKPGIAGLILGAIAIEFPHILGVGYETTDTALAGVFPLQVLLVLLVLKAAATAGARRLCHRRHGRGGRRGAGGADLHDPHHF